MPSSVVFHFVLLRYVADSAMDVLGGAAHTTGEVSLQLYNSFYQKQRELSVVAGSMQLAAPHALTAADGCHMELLSKVHRWRMHHNRS